MKLYTKTGDAGFTSLYDGSRVGKSDDIIELLGAIDELQVRIGLVIPSYAPEGEKGDGNEVNCRLDLQRIQRTLIKCSSTIAKTAGFSLYDQVETEWLEERIDALDLYVPPLTKFILIGTSIENARIHSCRTATRHVERLFWKAAESDETLRVGVLQPDIGKYLNRLSDYFFALARMRTWTHNEEEIQV